MGITWLASYPKSGNTWVRFLLHSAIYGPAQSSLDIARKIPDIHRPLPFDPPSDNKILCKTHFALSPKHPKLAQTDKAVLIIRDPRDVLFSALNYRRLNGLTKDQLSDEQYAKSFIAAQGDPQFAAIGYGTWSSHISSWQSNTTFPVHTIRYESLKQTPADHLRALADFLGYEFSDETIAAAVKASSFDSMRAMEIREKSKQKKQPAPGAKPTTLFVGTPKASQSKTYFMNTGHSGQSLASISPAIEQAFNKAFAEPMRKHGYEPTSG